MFLATKVCRAVLSRVHVLHALVKIICPTYLVHEVVYSVDVAAHYSVIEVL